MDETLATMTPSPQLAPVPALSDAQPQASDRAPGRAVRGAAPQLAQKKEAPGSKAHLARYDGNVVFIGHQCAPPQAKQRHLPAGGPLA
eukprot:5639011-Pleurochrysis_carterae.AAC.1